MTNKDQIDADAEREALALQKQGRSETRYHVRQAKDYNADKFEELFKCS